MKNKMIEENLCYGLIDEIEKINKECNNESELRKKEILQKNFKAAFQKISEVIDSELSGKVTIQKVDSILNNLEEIFKGSRSNLTNEISNIYQENDSTYSIVALLNNKVENLIENIENIENDNEELEQTNEVFMSKMNEMEYNLSDERQYATSIINNSISHQVEDKIITELEHEINSLFAQNNIVEESTLNELEYQIKYILNSDLKTKTLDEFYNIDRENIENIQGKEVICFKKIKRNCMMALKNQVEEELESLGDKQEKKSDTLGLSNLVNDEKQAGIQTNLRENKEKDNLRQNDIISLPSDVII